MYLKIKTNQRGRKKTDHQSEGISKNDNQSEGLDFKLITNQMAKF